MNIFFLVGLITENPNFKFILSKNLNFKDCLHISVTTFELKINDLTFLKVKAYDELADYCYANFKRGDYIVISGNMNDKKEIDIDFCQRL